MLPTPWNVAHHSRPMDRHEIEQRMNELGITNKDLGKKSGVRSSTLTPILKGDKPLTDKMAYRIQKALDDMAKEVPSLDEMIELILFEKNRLGMNWTKLGSAFDKTSSHLYQILHKKTRFGYKHRKKLLPHLLRLQGLSPLTAQRPLG